MNPCAVKAPLVVLDAAALLSGICRAQSLPEQLERADQPAPRTDANSRLAHMQLLEKARKGGIDIYFEGDSITRRWGTSDPQYRENLMNWTSNFFGWNAADFGWGADRTQNILWRLENGELDGVNPKVIVILAGSNNVGPRPPDDAEIADITRGLKAILDICRVKAPGAAIIITAIFPRNDNMAVIPGISRINENIARFADGKMVRYLNVNDKLADANGKLSDGMMNPDDKLHPTVKGYQVWADGRSSQSYWDRRPRRTTPLRLLAIRVSNTVKGDSLCACFCRRPDTSIEHEKDARSDNRPCWRSAWIFARASLYGWLSEHGFPDNHMGTSK